LVPRGTFKVAGVDMATGDSAAAGPVYHAKPINTAAILADEPVAPAEATQKAHRLSFALVIADFRLLISLQLYSAFLEWIFLHNHI
jgi:predicted short-subunit dehydrogenase-like oxidoreductase (DUF2520 family)